MKSTLGYPRLCWAVLLPLLLLACSGSTQQGDDWPEGYNRAYARTPFFIDRPGWGSTPILYFCERNGWHNSPYHLLIDKRGNEDRIPWQGSSRDISIVEAPQSDPWGFVESGALQAINWKQWSTLFFAVRFYNAPSESYPLKIELRWGEDYEAWEAAPFVEASLGLLPDEGDPFYIEGKVQVLSPAPEDIGPIFSFRISLYDPDGLGNYFRFFEARWQRAEIPTEDFFRDRDCGPDYP